jgi:hypothetical protein
MSALQSAPADWRADYQALQDIREALRSRPNFNEDKLTIMGSKEDCWSNHGYYWDARIKNAGYKVGEKRRWLNVLCQVTPEGGVSYQLFGSDFPTLEPGWTGASFDALIERIKTL